MLNMLQCDIPEKKLNFFSKTTRQRVVKYCMLPPPPRIFCKHAGILRHLAKNVHPCTLLATSFDSAETLLLIKPAASAPLLINAQRIRTNKDVCGYLHLLIRYSPRLFAKKQTEKLFNNIRYICRITINKLILSISEKFIDKRRTKQYRTPRYSNIGVCDTIISECPAN